MKDFITAEQRMSGLDLDTPIELQIQPGIYDLDIENYHNSVGISRSGIMTFKKSPLHFWHENVNPAYISPKPTEAMIFGNALHTYLLERNLFNSRYAVSPKFDRRTKEGKESFTKFEKESLGKIIIDPDMMTKIKEMSYEIEIRPQASGLIKGDQNETSIYWIDKDSGLLCKSRPDIWHSNMIVDFKTTSNASYRECQHSIYRYGYHIQAAMILDAICENTGKAIDNYILLFQEKEAPYATSIYILDQSAIEAGRKEYKSQLMRLKECFDTNQWPSYPISTISLPNWSNCEE